MAGSWIWPKLINKIKDDIPFLQQALNALLKRDPTSISDIPTGAKRLVEISAGKWQEQEYNGTSWEPIGKLMHDVDQLDGYNASITPSANTVAVRNKNGLLEDSITGNAASSDVAGTLSQTLPVNKGGTGATTSAAARTNLGVPPTSHASASTTYGLATDTNYGHVRSDSKTTKINSGQVVVKDVAIGGDSTDLASERGIFNSKNLGSVDYNTILKQGFYTAYSTGSTNGPGGPRRLIVLNDTGDDNDVVQIAISNQPTDGKHLYLDIRAFHPTNGWTDWMKSILESDVATASVAGIMKPGDGLEAEANGVVGVDDTVVRTTGAQSIKGVKTFNDEVRLSKSGLCRYVLQNLDLPAQRTGSVSANTYTRLDFYNGGGLNNAKNRMANLIFTKFANGNSTLELNCINPYNDDSEEYCQLTCGWGRYSDGTPYPYVSCPTPAKESNTNYIATTEWVRDRIDESKTSINSSITDSSMIPNNRGWISKSQNTLYTAEKNGYIFFVVNGSGHCATGTVYIDNQTQNLAVSQYGSGSCNERNGYTFPIAKGSTYKSTGGTLYWIPVK